MSNENSDTRHPRIENRTDAPDSFRSHVSTDTYVSNVTFRGLSQGIAEDGSFFQVHNRSVLFDYELDHEVAKSTTRSQAAIVSILPMARDNDRFFDAGEFGYGDLLATAAATLEAGVESSNRFWKEGESDATFSGWIWRLFVRFLLVFINNGVNRLRFTRGIQDSLPFLTGYESYAVGDVIQ